MKPREGWLLCQRRGVDPAIVTGWIAEVEAERRRVHAVLTRPETGTAPRMSREQIADLVRSVGKTVTVLNGAGPADRAEVYQQLACD